MSIMSIDKDEAMKSTVTAPNDVIDRAEFVQPRLVGEVGVQTGVAVITTLKSTNKAGVLDLD